MSERVHLLAQSILGKSSIEDCTLQDTRDLAKRYPYFAPAQFLYLQKLRTTNTEEYLKQLQKAVLYYHNPLAFEYFISSDRFLTEIEFNRSSAVVPGEQTATNWTDEIKDQAEPVDSVPEASFSTTAPEPVIDVISSQQNRQGSETPVETGDQLNETGQAEIKPETLETKTPSQEPQTPNLTSESGISFEPYHTVDYFASQGIRLSQEEVSKDKFGKQLKSFTDWLKTMKRLPANEVGRMDTSTEKKVSHLAEDSVHNSDVITEAMAEVWLKQGNHEKAIETYNKLSLLNPSKKAYFATLIENLKRS